MEQIKEPSVTARKVYKDRAIWLGTFLGGPLAAGYLIAENFKTFNENEKATKTWILAILATIAIFGGVYLIPENVKIPNQLIPLIYTGIAYFLVQHFQGQNINDHINSGGEIFGWWRTILVSIIGLALTIIPIIVIVLLSNSSPITGVTKTYGDLKHEIIYNRDNITENEIDLIAEGLTKATFFDEAQQKSVFVKKEESKYVIMIPVVDNAWNDQNALGFFQQLRNDMQVYLPDHKLVIDLCADLDNIKTRIE